MKVERVPSWIDNTTKLTGDNFKKVFIFFVINNPVPKKSARAIDIPLETIIPIKYKVVEKAECMEDYLIQDNLLQFPPTGDYYERAVFVRSDNNITITFIDHIRNSIAHGRFNIINNGKNSQILVSEDVNKNVECNARIVVRVKTLCEWIDQIRKNS